MLVTVTMTGRYEHSAHYKPIWAFAVVLVTGVLLIYGTLDMPYFGSVDAPAQLHVAPRYINNSMQEIGVPNIVTSVLASYRGYDTLGEVVVIFTAGVGVLALLCRLSGLSFRLVVGSYHLFSVIDLVRMNRVNAIADC